MDPPTAQLPPQSPPAGTPLASISPERLNNMRSPPLLMTATGRGSMPTSPTSSTSAVSDNASNTNYYGSLKLGSPPKLRASHHMRNSSSSSDAGVRAAVARFEQLDPHRDQAAAVRRAEMAREMAELDARRLRDDKDGFEREARRIREESRKMKKEVEESRERERKVAKRLEVVMEELHRAKETHSHAQGLYEKEIRKARKEAFKSSSALVKMQEELKATRNSLRITQSGLESEKIKCQKREQEAFQAEYKMVGVQEELSKAKQQIKTVEEERDALKTSLKEEEVARIAAEGLIALPASNPGEEDEFDSPKKSPSKLRAYDGSDKENFVPSSPSSRSAELKAVHEELAAERRRRERAEDTVDFMKMECQFQCCSCRMAELSGDSYVHDDTFEKEMSKIRNSQPVSMTPPISDVGDADVDAMVKRPVPMNVSRPATPPDSATLTDEQRELLFSPTTGTFRSVPSPNKSAETEEKPQIEDVEMADADAPPPAEPTAQPAALPTPVEPAPMEVEAAVEQQRQQTSMRPPSPPRTPAPVERGRSHTSHGHHHYASRNAFHEQPSRAATATPANINNNFFHRTVTTTTTIPMCFDSPKPVHNNNSNQHFHTVSRSTFAASSSSARPGVLDAFATPTAAEKHALTRTPSFKDRPFDREVALEQIQERRRRARSVAEGRATPRRQMVEGAGVRRDCSAPV
ncbi:chromosome segregation protein smc-like [Diplodia corticola]|uniref:Chromosome segregation protein smc-like n=1 Tax=Diplodia corticola TaxID=236234 RepID=A0A1J9RQN6_9PEZI|nr:chromosome segregation protein smc-like [Diplodia corticola]OJD30759.1 chromosome segregation protein smc-like [Diplodia corticola]